MCDLAITSVTITSCGDLYQRRLALIGCLTGQSAAVPHDQQPFHAELKVSVEKVMIMFSDLCGSGWSCLSSAIAMVTGKR